MSATDDVLVSVRGLKTYYSIRGSFLDRLVGRTGAAVRAVDDVSLDLRKGEVLGLVGESGSGKTTLGRTLLGLVPATEGTVEFEGQDITHAERARPAVAAAADADRLPGPACVAQPGDDGRAGGRAIRSRSTGWRAAGSEVRARVADVLERVGLAPAEQFMDKFPSDLSGGQKQRAVIARAIILNPVLLVADEPVSMLDMSVRAKILELMLALKRDFDLTYLYITHDLATAKFFCDRIAIMYLGRIVEIGPSEAIYADPKHPYTQALLRAIPEPDPRRTIPRDLPRGEVPDAVAAAARVLVPSALPEGVRGVRLGVARPEGAARASLGGARRGGLRSGAGGGGADGGARRGEDARPAGGPWRRPRLGSAGPP